MYKEDLALNNLQWLICHNTQPNQNLTQKAFFFLSVKLFQRSKNKNTKEESSLSKPQLS